MVARISLFVVFSLGIAMRASDAQLANSYLLRGMARLEKKQYDRAINDFSEAIRLDPSNADAYNYRGDAWQRKREYGKAFEDYSHAIGIDAHDPYPYVRRAGAYFEQGKYEQAIGDYSTALRLKPRQRVAVIICRGFAWSMKGDHDKAIGDFSEVIEIDPTCGLAYLKRGDEWRAKGRYDNAIMDYREAIRIDPEDARAYGHWAWLMATCREVGYRDGDAAIKNATKACELSRWENPNHLDTLAAACAEVGRFDRAQEYQQKALKLAREKDTAEFQKRLRLYQDGRPYRE